ncbi:MAG: flagellar type III secretion system pore protein FliP [Deltaproteobacteria bacterium]|nr:flagellar type III secretion system pore protein FliP [Deltaproteobacteria bacterium]
MDASAVDGLQSLAASPTPAAVKLFLLVTAMSFVSAVLLCMTSFTRIIIVLGLMRQALGTPQTPPNQVLIGLALFLTAFVMAPTATRVHAEAWTPWAEDRMPTPEAVDRASGIVKAFMLAQTDAEDIRLFYDLSRRARPARGEDIPMTVAAPAFLLSELQTAFRMGLHLLVPMLLIDLLVSSILLSLGMMMVPPALLSLPLKLAVFALADGWRLLVSSLVRSFV